MQSTLGTHPGPRLRIGIAGAGLLGRLLAWTLAHQGHQVSVFDPAAGPHPSFDGQGAAGFTAAGMLSPLAELETAEPDVAERGWDAITRWAEIRADMALRQPIAPHFAREGSLMVAHRPDLGAARRVLSRLDALTHERAAPYRPQALDAPQLQSLEPDLHSTLGPLHAWLLPGEGQIDAAAMMQGLQADAPGVAWHWGRAVRQIGPGYLSLADEASPPRRRFDCVFDVRGVGARPEAPVRGVRGEVVWLHAPGLELQRPVRLLHPRHRVYIVPRPGDVVLVGASEIESEDRSPMSLRSAVELMAAAHSVLPGLAEARILRLDTNLRPALPDNRPEVHTEPGLVRLNGLYRHGWLLAPSVVDEALGRIGLGPTQDLIDATAPRPHALAPLAV
ncbi:MAG: FAD-dependent oxidoreductase [Aquabacterium sp.]|jgi:glycine oxidase|uniref:FAD-dependent oxidoreductase n=1 Tax=Aquabacterium sp. TaxID=1872578 RepID=UPI002A35E5A6|nr:FAD-dependent oxidoreductase [Aquabacterium sp.]MDX9842624.1 FAD-dependent oxidoreductase [Aquabacterium sp.]